MKKIPLLAVVMALCAFGHASAVIGAESQARSARPLPVARAPFARSGAAREPVKMVVKPFSWKTNLWDGVEFVSGSKRIVM